MLIKIRSGQCTYFCRMLPDQYTSELACRLADYSTTRNPFLQSFASAIAIYPSLQRTLPAPDRYLQGTPYPQQCWDHRRHRIRDPWDAKRPFWGLRQGTITIVCGRKRRKGI